MSEEPRTSKAAQDAAEKVLVSIYGEDLIGCRADLGQLSQIIQQGINSETKDYRELAEALIGALQQIQIVATPPNKSDIRSTEELVQLLGSRADAIRVITSKILTAWEGFQQREKS
jgi:hypothetical protein